MDFDTLDGPSIAFIVFVGIGVIVALIFITRWIFRVDSMLKHMTKQTKYLRAIAEKNGVASDAIDRIENTEIQL